MTIMVRKVKKRLFNIWQYTYVIILSIFDKSVELHIPRGRVIKKDWPGDEQELLFCLASMTMPISNFKFSGTSAKGSYSRHPKYKIFQGIINGQPARADPYFLSQDFGSIADAQMFLERKLEILRVATKGNQHFDVSGSFWVDGELRIADGEHRILALAALGKTQIRLGIVLEN